MLKNHCLLLSLCLMAGVGPAAGLPPGTTHTKEGLSAEAGEVLARVNGKPIYEGRLKPEVESRLETFRKHGMRRQNPDLVKRLQRKALDKAIGEELISQESRKRATKDIAEKVEQRVKALEAKYGAGERFEKYLKMRALTMESLRESLATRVRVDEYLREQGVLEPEIPEERVREVYQADPDSYSREESVKVSHVLIAVDENAGVEEKEQARKKAEQIRKQILEGQDFAEMAREHSDCNSAAGGGDLRYVKRGYMPEEFDKVAFAVEKNAVSEVVETKFGYHVVKVFDKIPAGVVPYEQVRGFITKFLQQEESKKKLAAHIAELKEEAKIEIFLPE